MLSPVKRTEPGEKSAQIKHRLQEKTVQNFSKFIYSCILMWDDNINFSLEEAFLGYGLMFWPEATV